MTETALQYSQCRAVSLSEFISLGIFQDNGGVLFPGIEKSPFSFQCNVSFTITKYYFRKSPKNLNLWHSNLFI